MGLSNAISGGIIMFGITFVIFTFGGLTDKAASFSDASSETSNWESKLVKTSIDVSIPNDPGTDSTFSFDITNTNLEKLWEFDKFDIIITYDSAGITQTETLTYDSACAPAIGEWCISTWTNDIIDPKILNNGESITVDVEVSNNIQSGSNLIVIVATQNGVVATETRDVA